MRHITRWFVALLVCALVLVACRQEPLPTDEVRFTVTPRPTQTPIVSAAPTDTPAPGPGATVAPVETLAQPTPTPNGPLPAVLAEINLGLPGGNGYAPAAVAVDERDIAYVVCQHCEGPNGVSCVALVDLARQSVLDMWPLPGGSTGPLAVGGGRLYVRYETAERAARLLMLDSETGRVLGDIAVPEMAYGEGLWVDVDLGLLIVPMDSGVQVRDAADLTIVAGVRDPLQAVDRAFAYDSAGGILFFSMSNVLHAYRATDLELLWHAETPTQSILRLVVEQGGQFVAAQGQRYDGETAELDLLLFGPAGEMLYACKPEFTMDEWHLVWADAASGRIVFSAREYKPRLPVRLHLWQSDLEGMPVDEPCQYADGLVRGLVGQPWVYVLGHSSHTLARIDGATLDTHQVAPLGVDLFDTVFDHDRGRLYVNDTGSRLYALGLDQIEQGMLQVEASISAGAGELTLDSQAGLLLVARAEGDGQRVSVVDLDRFQVTRVITGGDQVALDRRRGRAIVGRRPSLWSGIEGGTHVWDVASGRWLAALPETGAPAYNVARDEIYVAGYGCHVYNAETLDYVDSLTPDIDAQTCKGCSGETAVLDLSIHPDLDLLALHMTILSAGKGGGLVPAPRTYSLGTLEPVTHTASFLNWCGPNPLAMAPVKGRTYQNLVYSRYDYHANALARSAGDGEVLAERASLRLDFVTPDGQIGFVPRNGMWLALDLVDWVPLGYTPRYCIQGVDREIDALLAIDGARLTLLRPRWGHPERALEAQFAPYERGLRAVHPSPGYGTDQTVFTVGDKALYRSQDGGETWMRLYGGFPVLEQAGISSHLVAALSPAFGYDHTLFAGGWDAGDRGLGVWRSTDAGETWHPMWYGLEHLAVERIVLSGNYNQDGTLLAYCRFDDLERGTYGRSVFISEDRGESWRLETLSRRDLADIEPLPKPEELLAEVAEAGVSGRAAVRASAWEEAPPAPMIPLAEGERAIATVTPRIGEGRVLTHYVLTTAALYRAVATDDGWTISSVTDPTSQSGESYVELALAVDASGDDLLFLGTHSGALEVVAAHDLVWSESD